MSSYVMVGAGGTASHLLHALYRYLKAREANDKKWTLHIYDGDTVEERNLSRQIFGTPDIGKNKARALADAVGDSAHVIAYETYIGPDNIRKAIQEDDIVIICADNMFVRSLIEKHVSTFHNVVVLNGGNEEVTGSVQTWIREKKKNVTPRISWLHPEITDTNDGDRSGLSCAEIAGLPGGEQTILANMTSANLLLTALWRVHKGYHMTKGGPGIIPWTEINFDLRSGTVTPWDVRAAAKGWQSS